MKILFSGASHLSLVYAIAFCELGNDVTFYADGKDRDEILLVAQALAEPGLHQALIDSFNNNLTLISNLDRNLLSSQDLVVVATDTPTDEKGGRDYTNLITRLRTLDDMNYRKINTLLLSQVYPGFTRSQNLSAPVFYQVETLVFGNALHRARNPEQIILGVNDVQDEIPENLLSLYKKFKCEIKAMVYESAELAKIAINIMLIFSIVGSNVLVRLANTCGADWKDIEQILRGDARIGPLSYISPSLGISGNNLPRDASALNEILNNPLLFDEKRFFHSLLDYNSSLLNWVIRLIQQESIVENESEKSIGIFGLAYKVGTSSSIMSPAFRLVRKFIDLEFLLYDPFVSDFTPTANSKHCFDSKYVISRCKLLILLTPWPSIISELESTDTMHFKDKILIDPLGSLSSRKQFFAKYYSLA